MLRVGIMGYGNVAKGVECALKTTPDMELAAVFTRRDPAGVKILSENVPVLPASMAEEMADKIDVMILCGGSATDLGVQTPHYAKYFHVVDSFDTHAKINQHFAAVDPEAKAGGKVAIIACGWDPGLFSIARLYFEASLPEGSDYTFWGRGISQGHSDAIRRIEGVADARQYTVPSEEALEKVRAGERPVLTTSEKHKRDCYVVAKEGADLAAIENAIKTMPNYFADYDTSVTFVTAEELKKNHSGMPHAGSVLRNGTLGWNGEFNTELEFKLRLDSNPAFTGSVLVACARAAVRMGEKGESGCKTLYDVPPAYLSWKNGEELRGHLL